MGCALASTLTYTFIRVVRVIRDIRIFRDIRVIIRGRV